MCVTRLAGCWPGEPRDARDAMPCVEPARHGPDRGPLATWAVPDLDHVGQVARVMARRWSTAVGPWRDYLGILAR